MIRGIVNSLIVHYTKVQILRLASNTQTKQRYLYDRYEELHGKKTKIAAYQYGILVYKAQKIWPFGQAKCLRQVFNRLFY